MKTTQTAPRPPLSRRAFENNKYRGKFRFLVKYEHHGRNIGNPGEVFEAWLFGWPATQNLYDRGIIGLEDPSDALPVSDPVFNNPIAELSGPRPSLIRRIQRGALKIVKRWKI